MRMVSVEIVDEPAVVDFAQKMNVPEREGMYLLSVAILFIHLQCFLIDVKNRGKGWIKLGLQAGSEVVIEPPGAVDIEIPFPLVFRHQDLDGLLAVDLEIGDAL